MPRALRNKTFAANLQHLQIGCKGGVIWEEVLVLADNALTFRINEITRLCPTLRTCTIYIPKIRVEPARPWYYVWYRGLQEMCRASPRIFVSHTIWVWYFQAVVSMLIAILAPHSYTERGYCIVVWLFVSDCVYSLIRYCLRKLTRYKTR